MAQYLVKQRSFINGAIVEQGSTVDYDPPPGTTISDNLEPVKGKKSKPVSDTPSGDGASKAEGEAPPADTN